MPYVASSHKSIPNAARKKATYEQKTTKFNVKCSDNPEARVVLGGKASRCPADDHFLALIDVCQQIMTH